MEDKIRGILDAYPMTSRVRNALLSLFAELFERELERFKEEAAEDYEGMNRQRIELISERLNLQKEIAELKRQNEIMLNDRELLVKRGREIAGLKAKLDNLEKGE